MTESSNSPGGLKNHVVKIVNTARYADTVGRCTEYNEERQRYTIYIDAATQVSIKTDNLVLASMAESLKFRLNEARHRAEKIANDPTLRREVKGSLLNHVVKIVNTARYADTVGRCMAYNEERQRYTIYIDAATHVSIKIDNLVVASMAECLKFRLKEARNQAQEMANDPTLRREAIQIFYENIL